MKKKKVVAVIPARMASSRFPGKPLVNILDLPLVENVRRRALLCPRIDDAVVATCDQSILDMVQSYGGKAVMTANTHERCTDRVEEASHLLDLDIAVIVQGDEPLFFPEILETLVEPLLQDDKLLCTNLLSIIHDESDLSHQDIVKAVINNQQNVLYFSRAHIPFMRVKAPCPWYRQTGVSAFTKSFLQHFSRLPATPLEIVESVDLLRILEHGYSIRGVLCDQITIGVDRPEDVGKVEAILKSDEKQQSNYQKITRIA